MFFKKKKEEVSTETENTTTDIATSTEEAPKEEKKKESFLSKFKRKKKGEENAEDVETTEKPAKKKYIEASRDSILVAALVGGILALVIVDSLLFNDSTSDRYAGFLTLVTLLVGIFGAFTADLEARWMGRILNIMGVLQLIFMGILLYFELGNPALVIALNLFFVAALFFAAMLFRRDVQLEEAGLRIFRK